MATPIIEKVKREWAELQQREAAKQARAAEAERERLAREAEPVKREVRLQLFNLLADEFGPDAEAVRDAFAVEIQNDDADLLRPDSWVGSNVGIRLTRDGMAPIDLTYNRQDKAWVRSRVNQYCDETGVYVVRRMCWGGDKLTVNDEGDAYAVCDGLSEAIVEAEKSYDWSRQRLEEDRARKDKPAPPPTFPAFPTGENDADGMTLRDYFAGEALQDIALWSYQNPAVSPTDEVAGYCYTLADAMLKARAVK